MMRIRAEAFPPPPHRGPAEATTHPQPAVSATAVAAPFPWVDVRASGVAASATASLTAVPSAFAVATSLMSLQLLCLEQPGGRGVVTFAPLLTVSVH